VMNSGLAPTEFMWSLIEPLREHARRDGIWRPLQTARRVELMAQGGPAPFLFVLEAGLVKLAYATPDGSERIKSFIVDVGLFGPGLGDEEGRFSAITLEPSTTVALPTGWLLARLAESETLQQAQRRFEAWVRGRKEAREQALLCDSAETRYHNFLRHEPALARRLQQADIARYIGVTPIAFSRIKRRLDGRRIVR
jgi:CRP-like cAMP-binding protein